MNDYFSLKMSVDEINQISSLGLAHIGDSVYELMVRSMIASKGKETANAMHKLKLDYVTAQKQSEFILKVMDMLTEEEICVYKRGRNATPHRTIPKNCSKEIYQKSSGVEALFGYLFLKGEKERINELFSIMISE